MDHSEVVALLKSDLRPDENVLLDDGEFYVEHNAGYPLERGNGFLLRRCKVTLTTPGGYECVGGYNQKPDGQWCADVHVLFDEASDSDCCRVGVYGDRLDAIAALWLARHTAHKSNK